MPRPSQRAQARRAFVPEPRIGSSSTAKTSLGRRWLQHGLAALAVSALGLGVAGSIALTGNAQRVSSSPATSTPPVQITVAPGAVVPDDFNRVERASRSSDRPALRAVAGRLDAREEALESASKAIEREADVLAEEEAAEKKRRAEQERKRREEAGPPTLPVTDGYSIAARFGAVGSWSRYHTGFDFSAPIGTPVHAPTVGVVTTAGSGSASGWAGTYVTIRHPDGTQTLYAHLSGVNVQVGDTVRGGDVVGRVGVSGRSFGPHLHFEVYPAGVEPGDVYAAVDPQPWLAELGLRP